MTRATLHRTFVRSLPSYLMDVPVRRLARIVASSWVGMTMLLVALANVDAQTAAAPSSIEKAAVDALIPWLLQEDAQLRGIPFSEVIFDATGKRVLAFNLKDETDARVAKQISTVLDEVMARLNASHSAIQGIPRINEVSSHFEDLIRELLTKRPVSPVISRKQPPVENSVPVTPSLN
jgi:hypothetical protein